MNSVKRIIKEVRKNGNKAVRRYTAIFDKVKLKNFKVSEKEIDEAYKKLDRETIDVLKKAAKKLAKIAKKFAKIEGLDGHKKSDEIRL